MVQPPIRQRQVANTGERERDSKHNNTHMHAHIGDTTEPTIPQQQKDVFGMHARYARVVVVLCLLAELIQNKEEQKGEKCDIGHVQIGQIVFSVLSENHY